ncbi:hypothetical protein ACFFX0_12420 [Citricoccus parietis]|uniref:Uncharacterized protein n=1 Tax=Citricoccus parietis TaxID=592307 RepID=A0ABV5FZ81_9MICC
MPLLAGAKQRGQVTPGPFGSRHVDTLIDQRVGLWQGTSMDLQAGPDGCVSAMRDGHLETVQTVQPGRERDTMPSGGRAVREDSPDLAHYGGGVLCFQLRSRQGLRSGPVYPAGKGGDVRGLQSIPGYLVEGALIRGEGRAPEWRRQRASMSHGAESAG